MYDDVKVAVDQDYEALFRRTYPKLVSLGVIKCGRLDVARELAQETLLRAHHRWGDVAGYDSPDAWCRSVMVNLLVDHFRSASSEARAVARLGADRETTASMPELTRWWDLVGPLPERQRAVVTLHYADGMSVGEIAATLGVATGTVKASLFKARRTLRRRLEAEEAQGDA